MIKITGLTKSFEDYKALRGLNLTVEKGSIYALVGVNGSGKTTAIKHLMGIFSPDEGEILIDGSPVYDKSDVKAKLGYVSDELYFFPQYNLKKLGRFYNNMYSTWNSDRFNELIELMGLDKKRRVSRFSKGMQKQAALCLALSSMPEVLVLDEPIDGLDPIVRHKIFRWIIDDVAARQMTVLISSHNLKEMDGICDSVGIIKDGMMIMERDLDVLKSEMQEKAISGDLPPTLDEIFIYIYENADSKEVSND